LRPGILDDLGLVATIEWQLQEFQTRSGIQGKLISAPEETTLDADGATAAFRIFQEILTNVARHAQATQDDRPIVRQGLRQTLSEIPDMGIAGEADPQQGPGSGPDRRIAGESEGRGGAMTIKETNVMPQWQTFNVVGGMIARNEAG
jgi:glucose-6-phosphate-specific signal transduction histidine kinase